MGRSDEARAEPNIEDEKGPCALLGIWNAYLKDKKQGLLPGDVDVVEQ